MENKPNTKSFNITEIPFDWKIEKLCKVVPNEKQITYGIVKAGDYNMGDIYMVRSQDYSTGWCSPNEMVKVTKEIEEPYARSRINKGDILITLVGAGLGNTAMVPDWLDGANISRSSGRIAINEKKANKNYIYQYLCSGVLDNIISKTLIGGAQPVLNLNALNNIDIYFPPLPEQRAIAHVLGLMDSAINQNNQLIIQKELRKKWLMQNLLTGKKRLKGFENTKWKIQPLEDFIKPVVREVPKPNVPYLGIGLRSHGKGTFLKHDEQPEKNSMDKFYVVRPNDLIVNITFAWEQAIAIVRPTDDGALASHRFPTYTFIDGKGHPDFFRFFILQPRMKFMLELISPGGAGRNRVMNKSDFIKLEFMLPEYNEQNAIAQVLQAADKEIQLLKTKTNKLREQKKGMMQVLLTGKKRLKI